MNRRLIALTTSIILGLSLIGCANETSSLTTNATAETSTVSMASSETNTTEGSTQEAIATTTVIEGSILDVANLFSERDLSQTADMSTAKSLTLNSDKEVTITEEGVYVLSGTVSNVTVVVEAPEDAKVQLVLDGLTVTNQDAPFIYVKSADKVFVTMTESDNSIEVTGSYVADGDTNLDAAIFSKSDLVLNGLGNLKIQSPNGNGVTSKDDMKITGGSYSVTAGSDGFEANDGLYIYDGSFDVNVQKDAFHSENDEDTTVGDMYIKNGTFQISAGDDAFQGTTMMQIDGGTINIETSTEGIEATFIQINGGEITLYASDDGINASQKSSLAIGIEVNGGTINVIMGAGDTDGFDANGTITINDGIINVTGGSSFDADGTALINGGTVTVNGEVITEITESQMGPGGNKPNGMGGKRP